MKCSKKQRKLCIAGQLIDGEMYSGKLTFCQSSSFLGDVFQWLSYVGDIQMFTQNIKYIQS